MNFQTMDYFVAVAEEKSFTKAAERLSVTQQTLSANIAAAEKELGSKLLERTVPLSLTFAGEEFLRYARRFQFKPIRFFIYWHAPISFTCFRTLL